MERHITVETRDGLVDVNLDHVVTMKADADTTLLLIAHVGTLVVLETIETVRSKINEALGLFEGVEYGTA
jgi:uncharacterized protein YlzI (FlbEa/FlbD family)